MFALISMICFIEDRLDPKLKNVLFVIVGIILILMAGFREVGFDPDSDVYEDYYHSYYNINMLDSVDYSFILLAQFFNNFTKDVHILFLFYAFWGLTLKFVAFRTYAKDILFLITLMYVSYFYEMHETCQIRTGILSGLFLLAIPYIAEKKRWIAFLLLLLGTFFHMSGLILFPLLILDNKTFDWKRMLFWSSLIPLSYIFIKGLGAVSLESEIPYIGSKLETYQEEEDTGARIVSGLNVYSPLQFFSVFIFYYLMFFANEISKKVKYFPLLLKIYAVGMFTMVVFSFLPVLGERIGWLYRTVTIVAVPCIYYTIKPRWLSICIVIFVCFIYLNYSLRSMYEFLLFLSR